MNPYQNYLANQVQTASPEQILIMLYDGAIRFLRQARQALDEEDRVGMLEKKSRALAIITELANSLDFETGGEVAENLDGLYWYMSRELMRANGRDGAEALEASENILAELRDGWFQAIEANRPEAEEGSQAYDTPPTAGAVPGEALSAAV